MSVAIYPGSFDPVTVGHVDIIKRAASHFDTLYVAVMCNNAKNVSFSPQERVEMINISISKLAIDNVKVIHYDGLLADLAEKLGAATIVKGLRAVSDFEYEFQMALANKRLNRNLETVFFMADEKHMYISSSIVRSIAYFGGDISGFVVPEIAPIVLDRISKNTQDS